jgi:hypothetical protein
VSQENKPVLVWREPKAVLRWRKRQEPVGRRDWAEFIAFLFVAALFTAGGMMGGGGKYTSPQWPGLPFGEALLQGVVFSAVFCVAIFAAGRLPRPYAWITGRAVCWSHSWETRRNSFENIAVAEIGGLDLNGDHYALLRLVDRNGRPTVIGLPPDLEGRVRIVLEKAGIRVA